MSILLQADMLLDNFWEGLLYPFTSTLGVPVFALMVFAGIGFAYYQVQRSMIIPLISLVLVGGVTIGLAPESAGNAILAMAILAITAMGYIVFNRARSGR